MEPLHIDDDSVKALLEDVAREACQRLDEAFPGGDGGGITSNFQGLLVEVLGEMLCGRDPHFVKRGHFTALPPLVHTDRSFGDPGQGGEVFFVQRKSDRHVLNWNETAFLQPTAEDGIDPSTTFEAAVQAAMKYLRANETDVRSAGLQVVGLSMDSFRKHGAVALPISTVLDPNRMPFARMVCALLDCGVLTDIDVDDATGRSVPIVGLGERPELAAGLLGYWATPPFKSMGALEDFCRVNVENYRQVDYAQDGGPSQWFWEREQASDTTHRG